MTKTSNYKIGIVSLMLAMGFQTTGCDGFALEGERAGFGTIEMALTTVGTDRQTYRLKSTQLVIEPSVVIDLDEAFIQSDRIETRLNAGTYIVSLSDGWELERWDGQEFVPVASIMTSSNPQTVTVRPSETTPVVFNFETQDANVEFATGTLEVWLEVSQTICATGRMVGRSCGNNLLGKQFQVCDAGWWTDWTGCSESCNGGFCMFSGQADYGDLAVAMSPSHLDFEETLDGKSVDPATNRITSGDDLSTEVTFASFGVSSQTLPADSSIPYRGQRLDSIVLDGGWTSGDARIRSSAGSENNAGFDGIEITFEAAANGSALLGAVELVLDGNAAGYTVELFSTASHLPVSTFEVEVASGNRITFAADSTRPSAFAVSRVRIAPTVDTFEMLETHEWAIKDLSWSY